MSERGFPLGTAGMALLIALGGVWAFERALRWSDSERPLEDLAGGVAQLREIEASMGEAPPDVGVGTGRTDPLYAPVVAERTAEQPEDDSPVMDLEHLSDRDLDFLREVLEGEDERARLSATRALVISGHPEAIPMLFDAASRPGEDRDIFCLAALEVARLHRRRDVLVALLAAAEHEPPLSSSCRAEVEDRFALIGGRDPATLAGLYPDPDPRLRAWALRLLADEEGEGVEAILLAGVRDEEPELRALAWSAWAGRELGAHRAALREAAEAEEDPEIAAVAAEVLAR